MNDSVLRDQLVRIDGSAGDRLNGTAALRRPRPGRTLSRKQAGANGPRTGQWKCRIHQDSAA